MRYQPHPLLCNPLRLPGGASARRLDAPTSVVHLFCRVLGASGVAHPLVFVWADHLGDRIGLYSDGVVAIGEKDIRTLALRVQWQSADIAIDYGTAWWASLQFILAHEVAHAVQDEIGSSLVGPARECDADAGGTSTAAILGWDLLLHERVAYAIGCEVSPCSHPSPMGRVHCARRGMCVETCSCVEMAPYEWTIRGPHGTWFAFE